MACTSLPSLCADANDALAGILEDPYHKLAAGCTDGQPDTNNTPSSSHHTHRFMPSVLSMIAEGSHECESTLAAPSSPMMDSRLRGPILSGEATHQEEPLSPSTPENDDNDDDDKSAPKPKELESSPSDDDEEVVLLAATPSIVHYVDEKSKAQSRKQELEALRQKSRVTSEAALLKEATAPTTELEEVFRKQRELTHEDRTHKLEAKNMLNNYRANEDMVLKQVNAKRHSSSSSSLEVDSPTKPLSPSALTEMDQFHRDQTNMKQQWKLEKKQTIDMLHGFKDQSQHENTGDDSGEQSLLLENIETLSLPNSIEVVQKLDRRDDCVPEVFGIADGISIRVSVQETTALESSVVQTPDNAEVDGESKTPCRQTEAARVPLPESPTTSSLGNSSQGPIIEGKHTVSSIQLENENNVSPMLEVTTEHAEASVTSTSTSKSITSPSNTRHQPPLQRVPLYRRPPKEQAGHCESKFIPNLHSKKDACERCLYWASEDEKAQFRTTGHHLRIMMVKGGCDRSCRVFPRTDQEFPVRLCQKCFHDTHKKVTPADEWNRVTISADACVFVRQGSY